MIIITAVGADRPGMVHALAAALAEAGCNIADTTMTRLLNEFAIIAVVSPPPQLTLRELERRLKPLESSHGLAIHCKSVAHSAVPVIGLPRYVISLYGPENTGLVASITQVLTDLEVNITDVQTRIASHGTVYIMVFEVEVPQAVAGAILEDALAKRAAAIGLQVTVNPLEEEIL
jgi:glycine cleavage system transcriptional repressor